MKTLTDQFRDAVNAFLRRTGTPAARLGARILRDPSFVSRLRRGRVPNLDTADCVLLHIGQAPLGPAFRAEVDEFLRVTGTKAYMLGMDAVGDPSFVARLRKGASPRLDTVGRARNWMVSQSDAAVRKAMEARTVSVFSPLETLGAGRSGKYRAVGENNSHKIRNGSEGNKGKNNLHRGNSRGDNDQNNQRNNRGGNTPMKEQQQHPKYLDTREAADFLGLSNRTLDRYRVTGEGPVFHKFGNRIRYALADLEAWATARRVRSTSEADLGAWRTA